MATPRSWPGPRLYTDSDTLVGTLDFGSLRVATATMGFKHTPLDPEVARAEIGMPTLMLKTIPGTTGRRASAARASRITDLTIKGA